MTDVICVVKNKLLEKELKGCVLLLVLNCKRFQKRLAKGLSIVRVSQSVFKYLNTCFQHFGAWLPSSTPTASSPSILKTCAACSLIVPGEECDLVLFASRLSPPQEAFANWARTSSQRVWIPSVQHRRAARRRPSRLRQMVSLSRFRSLLDSPPSIAATLFAVPTILTRKGCTFIYLHL